MNICFWLGFSAIVVLFILEMINVVPVLKKDTSEEEKIKRYIEKESKRNTGT